MKELIRSIAIGVLLSFTIEQGHSDELHELSISYLENYLAQYEQTVLQPTSIKYSIKQELDITDDDLNRHRDDRLILFHRVKGMFIEESWKNEYFEQTKRSLNQNKIPTEDGIENSSSFEEIRYYRNHGIEAKYFGDRNIAQIDFLSVGDRDTRWKNHSGFSWIRTMYFYVTGQRYEVNQVKKSKNKERKKVEK